MSQDPHRSVKPNRILGVSNGQVNEVLMEMSQGRGRRQPTRFSSLWRRRGFLHFQATCFLGGIPALNQRMELLPRRARRVDRPVQHTYQQHREDPPR